MALGDILKYIENFYVNKSKAAQKNHWIVKFFIDFSVSIPYNHYIGQKLRREPVGAVVFFREGTDGASSWCKALNPSPSCGIEGKVGSAGGARYRTAAQDVPKSAETGFPNLGGTADKKVRPKRRILGRFLLEFFF